MVYKKILGFYLVIYNPNIFLAIVHQLEFESFYSNQFHKDPKIYLTLVLEFLHRWCFVKPPT